MSENSQAIKSLFEDSGSHSLENSSDLIGYLQRLQNLCGERLEEYGPEDFARAWLLQRLTSEVLQNSIEDNYVDMGQDVATIKGSLDQLRRSDSWIDGKVEDLLRACRSIAKRPAAKPLMVELTLPACSIIARLAGPDQPLLQVSSRTYPLVPILEDNATNPLYLRGIERAYGAALQSLKEKHGVTALCFVEKEVGPVGALSMFSALVSALDCKATIYRVGHWSKRGKIAAYRPNAADRVAIVYDLMVSGDAIQQVSEDLKTRLGVSVVGAVVLFGYDRSLTPLTVGDQKIDVVALGWYEDFATAIGVFRRQQIASGSIQFAPSSWNGEEGLDSTKEDSMLAPNDQEETLGLVVDGLEDCDLTELKKIAKTIGWSSVQFEESSETQLRSDLIMFAQKSSDLSVLKAMQEELVRLALDFLNRD